jgi:hypothetical protein
MLSLYGLGSPAHALAVADELKANCPDIFAYGTISSNSTCGRSILSSYTAAVNAAAASAASKIMINGSSLAAGALSSGSNASSYSAGSGSSSSNVTVPARSLLQTLPAGSSSSSSASHIVPFTATSVKVRQLPEVSNWHASSIMLVDRRLVLLCMLARLRAHLIAGWSSLVCAVNGVMRGLLCTAYSPLLLIYISLIIIMLQTTDSQCGRQFGIL